MEKKESFINPINKDKVAENPGLLPYAHTIGGVAIVPIDVSSVKGRAVQAMRDQTDMHKGQIYEQIELLARQVKEIEYRKWVSEQIYGADMSFEPSINKTYHLYQRKNEVLLLSLVSPDEWGRRGHPFKEYIATVKLLADHTWEITAKGNEEHFTE